MLTTNVCGSFSGSVGPDDTYVLAGALGTWGADDSNRDYKGWKVCMFLMWLSGLVLTLDVKGLLVSKPHTSKQLLANGG